MKKDNKKITLSHGEGTLASRKLVEEVILKYFSGKTLSKLEDSAQLNIPDNKIAFTTDGYVINPIFFEGGDIGKLSICGTVNDLSVKGAIAKYISVSFILEEGFEISQFEKILISMAQAAKESKVEIVTGDTKVVPKGNCDKIFISTSGIGIIPKNADISTSKIENNDTIIINGNLAEHGITILNQRNNLGFKSKIKSDCQSLAILLQDLIKKFGTDIHFARDLTRGGLASCLNEVAPIIKKQIVLKQKDIPISKAVKNISQILGLNPLQIANEGKFVCFVKSSKANKILKQIQKHPYGKNAKIIGIVSSTQDGKVLIENELGIKTQLKTSDSQLLPRIC